MNARRNQAGAALLTAMIIVTLIASLAAGMVWQQYRAVQIEAADRARAQSGWLLQGALDWARLILKEDLRGDQSKPPPKDHLGEPWAVPLAEARLSTFLAADRANASDDEGPEAFLSGTIEDAQSRYNLAAVTAGAQVAQDEKLTLEQLCTQVNAPPDTATLIINGLRAAFPTPASGANPPPSSAATNSNGPLKPAGLDQLRWLGLDADTLKRLQPYVVLLPRPTPVNLNTAPREVIAALLHIDLASAERIVQGRKGRPLQTVADAATYLSSNFQIPPARASVDSAFFIVTGRLRLEERQLEQRSLIERLPSQETKVLARERISQLLDR